MTPDPGTAGPDYDVEIRPFWLRVGAFGTAVLVVIAHTVTGFFLKAGSSGVVFQTSDQVAIGLLGVVIAGAILLFTRPRLRIGPTGVLVRNLLGERLITWSELVGVSFPASSRWARIDLPGDEYVPVMAIESIDKERAIAAMQELRAQLARHRPDLA